MFTKQLLLLIATFSMYATSDAQVVNRRVARQGQQKKLQRIKQNLPKFEPTVNISFGYGFPNLDKNEFPEYYNLYKGSINQTGPFTGSVDYQFSRKASIGLLVTHGKVSTPYYDYSNASALSGSLINWSFMLNLIRYMPGAKKVTPYIRTAIGINAWEQNYTDVDGNKINPPTIPGDFAYQVGLGAKFILSKNAGFFLEAGYGKYILNTGLAVKF
ncbi:MAG: hypothetical protein H7Y86_10970 [Rhizobacter sp.]|nr:hypothetical protein [Ferruginibacter sp.]